MHVTSGQEQSIALPRRSIADAKRIPDAAIFLKRTTLEFLQILFASRPQGDLRYSDDSSTEIQISDVHAVDQEAIGRRPAIVAVRGPLSWQGLGLGGGSVETRDMKTGDYTFNDLLTGSVAFSCISREGVEAELIGGLVFNAFKFFRPVLQKYGFFTIKSLNIGAEALIESEGADDRTTVVPVYVTAQIQDRRTLTDTSGRKLKQVILDTLTVEP